MRYYVIPVAVAFVAGAGLGTSVGDAIPIVAWWGFAVGSAGIGLLLRRHSRVCRTGLLLSLFALGAVRGGVAPASFPDSLLRRAAFLHELTGTVVSYPSLGARHLAFTFQPDVLPACVRVTWFPSSERDRSLLYGDRLILVGTARLPEAFSGFDYPAYLARRGTFATMIVEGSEGIVPLGDWSGSAVLRMGDRVRQTLLTRLGTVLTAADVALAQGLLLGDRTALSEQAETSFRRIGLMHVLAVSGLHLGILLAGAWLVLRRVGLRPTIAYPVAGCLVACALWVVGPRVSLVRAAVLFAFLGVGSVLCDLGLVLRRTVRPLNGVAAAGLLIVAIRPGALFDAGFQLTVAATAAILVAMSPTFAWRRWLDRTGGRPFLGRRPVRGALTLLAVSVAAQAGAAPVVAIHFGALHPLAILANLLVVPLVAVTLWAGFLAAFVSGTSALPVAAIPFGGLLRGLSSWVNMLGRIPQVEMSVRPWVGWWLAALIGFAGIVGAYWGDRSS
jgi:competence protein ComEC